MYLDDASSAILRLYAERTKLTLIELAAIANASPMSFVDPINALRDEGYLRIEYNHLVGRKAATGSADGISFDDPLEITFKGRTALEQQDKLTKEKRNERIRYIITTSIAVVALIVSIVSIALQFG